LLCIAGYAYSQKVENYIIPSVNWSKWDTHFYKLKDKEFFLTSLFIDDKSLEIDSIPFFKIVNIDGLNDLDIIKTKGPDSIGLVIFTNNQSKLTKVYEDSVSIVEISQETPISPLSFKTMRVRKYGDKLEIDYMVSAIDDGTLSYRISRTDMISQGTKDVYRNMPPTYFRIKSGGTPLVEGPGLDQLIKTCNASEVGYAAGSVKTKNGDVWWKVFILEDNYKFRMGWLKRTDVLTGYQ